VLVDEAMVHRRCVLSVKHFTYPIIDPTHLKLASHVVICSAATDGQVMIWDATLLLQSWLDSVTECNANTDTVCPVVPLCVLSCHQSGVNDVDIRHTSGKTSWVTKCLVDLKSSFVNLDVYFIVIY